MNKQLPTNQPKVSNKLVNQPLIGEFEKLLAQELATLKAQVRKEIEELRAANGTNGKLNVYLDSDGFWQMTDHRYHNQALTDCLSIASLKEASNE